ncbi:ribonuclease H1 domain-containing protein [Clostridium sp. DL1XJH146]
MAKKYYAVKYGEHPSTGKVIKDKILSTWPECQKVVKGVKGAKYKSFSTIKEAEEFLKLGNMVFEKGKEEYDKDAVHAYVDGSYIHSDLKYSYGLVITLNGIVKYVENDAFIANRESNVRQVAGELRGAVRALEYARDNNINKIIIFHDYVGVANHVLGIWQAKEQSSIEYKEIMQQLMKDSGVEVQFVKVDAHTGDLFNEMADELAKVAVGNKISGQVSKILSSTKIKVQDEEVLMALDDIINSKALENIELVHSEEGTVHSSQGTVHSSQGTVHSEEGTVHSLQCKDYSGQCTIDDSQSAVSSLDNKGNSELLGGEDKDDNHQIDLIIKKIDFLNNDKKKLEKYLKSLLKKELIEVILKKN